MADRQFVKLTVEDRVATITIEHPPVNALNGQTLGELASVVDEIEDNPEVRAVVLTGAGQAFVAGADIREIASLEAPEQARTLLEQAHTFFDLLDNLPLPTIAA